jgi:hypothetical protein
MNKDAGNYQSASATLAGVRPSLERLGRLARSAGAGIRAGREFSSGKDGWTSRRSAESAASLPKGARQGSSLHVMRLGSVGAIFAASFTKIDHESAAGPPLSRQDFPGIGRFSSLRFPDFVSLNAVR